MGLARSSLAAAAVAGALIAAAPAGAATNNIFTQVGAAGPGFSGDNGPAAQAKINTPTGLEAMPDGGYLVADQSNKRVRRVAPDGTITSLPSTGFSTAINGLAILPDGGILVADSNGNVVRKIKDGVVTTVAGTGGAGYNGDNIAPTAAQLNFPTGVAARSDGTWLIADQDNNRVREVGLDNKIRTVAGTGGFGSTGDGGPATSAPVVGPADVALTSDGGFLVAEFDTNRVRKVSSGGTITRVAGTGAAGGTGDGGPAIDAKLMAPAGIAARADGGFIVSEHGGHRLRLVAPDGTISRIAGTGTAGFNGDDQPALNAQLNTPTGVAIDGEGDYLIADALNSRIRRVDAGDPPKPPDPPGPPPPPPPPKEHTLLGQITYEPPYGIGFEGLDGLGPFDTRDVPPFVTVRLRDAAGAELARSSYSRSDSGYGVLTIRGPVLYRLDELGSCDPCTLELSAGDVVQDTQTVSFSGEAGQTEANLVFGRATEGGVVKGSVNVPYGARTRDLNVVILGADGKVLADGSRTHSCRGEGVGCGSGPSPDYRLTGLPRDAVPVKIVLRQFTTGGKRVDADSADVVLDPSGTTIAPTLTAVPDLPAGLTKKGRRTLYGQINYRAPFAPGARLAGDLDVDPKDLRRLTVELRNSDGKLIQGTYRFTKTALGYTNYELGNNERDLKPCENCTVSLVDGTKVVDSATVTVPAEAPSLVRRDFNYAKAGKPEFLSGGVLIGDAGAKGLTVVVTDAATGEKLAGTDEGQQACAAGLRCPTKETLLYRIAGVPPHRDVILTLERKGTPVDTQRVHTAAADEITQAPLLVLPRGKGPRSIQGLVFNAGPFAPGEEPRAAIRSTALVARLVARDGTELKRGTARLVGDNEDARLGSATYFLDNLPECTGCTLELVRTDGVVEDRAVVDVRAASPSVTVSDLRWQAISGGSYVDGQVVVRKGEIAADDLVVRVIGADGKLLADSTKVKSQRKSRAGATGRDRGPFAYRLGGIPLDANKVKVVVLERGKKKALASTTVTLAVGGADTKVQDLKVDTDTRRGR